MTRIVALLVVMLLSYTAGIALASMVVGLLVVWETLR